jgi:hypothetical protein
MRMNLFEEKRRGNAIPDWEFRMRNEAPQFAEPGSKPYRKNNSSATDAQASCADEPSDKHFGACAM